MTNTVDVIEAVQIGYKYLSRKEKMVFNLVGQGLTSRAVQEELKIKRATFYTHIEEIHRKCYLSPNVRRRHEWRVLVAKAYHRLGQPGLVLQSAVAQPYNEGERIEC